MLRFLQFFIIGIVDNIEESKKYQRWEIVEIAKEKIRIIKEDIDIISDLDVSKKKNNVRKMLYKI